VSLHSDAVTDIDLSLSEYNLEGGLALQVEDDRRFQDHRPECLRHGLG
jgi:hypothetical protein